MPLCLIAFSRDVGAELASARGLSSSDRACYTVSVQSQITSHSPIITAEGALHG